MIRCINILEKIIYTVGDRMQYENLVKKQLSKHRYEHSVRVAQTAVKIAEAHDEDSNKAAIAGIMHDYCKEMPVEILIKKMVENKLMTSKYDLLMPQILHGPVASIVLKEQNIITDPQILQAIRFHTTGHWSMDRLAKIIFIADYVEPGRKTPNIEKILKISLSDLDEGVLEIVNQTMEYLSSKNRLIHEDMVKLRNEILTNKG